jgi:ribosome-associated protein
MPGLDDLHVRDDLVIPGWELWFTAARSSGPGGQHVNTSSTAVTLHWSVAGSSVLRDHQRALLLRKLGNRINRDGVLMVDGRDARSQHRNLEAARARLAELVAGALLRPKRRVATKPTRGSQRRRVDAKKQRGALKKLRGTPPDE